MARVPDIQSQHTDRLTNDRTDTEKNYHTGHNTPTDSSIQTVRQTQKLCNSTLLQPPPVHFQHRASRVAFVPSSKRNKNPFNKFINHIISSIATQSITFTYPQNQCLYHCEYNSEEERDGESEMTMQWLDCNH